MMSQTANPERAGSSASVRSHNSSRRVSSTPTHCGTASSSTTTSSPRDLSARASSPRTSSALPAQREKSAPRFSASSTSCAKRSSQRSAVSSSSMNAETASRHAAATTASSAKCFKRTRSDSAVTRAPCGVSSRAWRRGSSAWKLGQRRPSDLAGLRPELAQRARQVIYERQAVRRVRPAAPGEHPGANRFQFTQRADRSEDVGGRLGPALGQLPSKRT